MLNTLPQQPADALLALIKLHNEDPRADKIDLGVGVYRTGDGATPVFAAIKAAEKKLLETQDSKAYLGPEGDMGFVRALMRWVSNVTRASANSCRRSFGRAASATRSGVIFDGAGAVGAVCSR